MKRLNEMPPATLKFAAERILAIEVDAKLALSAVKHARKGRLVAGRAQRQLDDSGRRRKGIALRGQADADIDAGLDALVADDDSAHVEAIDADVAGGAPG